MKQKRVPMHRASYGSRAMKLPPLASFDLETEGLGGPFLSGALVTSDSQRLLFNDLENLFDWILEHPEYRYLCHNGSGYEFCYLYPLVYNFFAGRDDVSILPTVQGDTRIVQLRIVIETGKRTRRGKSAKTIIDLRDTLPLFNMPLKKVAESFCPELPKLTENINFDKETFDPSNPLHIDYVFRDCDVVLLAYCRLAATTEEVFHSPLGVTAGSTAMKAFKGMIPDGHVYYRLNGHSENFIRRCYYGGLVLPGRKVGNWGKIASVDINAAYAYQMKKNLFPIGAPSRTAFFVKGDVGFYHVLCTTPTSVFDTYGFNPIPVREKEGLAWPSGTFETFVSSVEIEFAETMGCTFKVLDGYVFSRYEPVFKEFVEKAEQIELSEPDKKPTIKLYRNALYGKFGQSTSHMRLVYSHEPVENAMPYVNQNATSIIDAVIPGLYITQEQSDADYMLPHWAALVTAYERVFLMGFVKEAYERGATNIYCDTDSIKGDVSVINAMVRDGCIPVGRYYGQFKVEEICENFIVLGPKCFVGYDNGNIPNLMKAKGIPNRVLNKKVYDGGLDGLTRPLAKGKRGKEREAHREVEFDSVKSLLSIMKENSHVKTIKRKRKITDLRNSWAWVLDKQGNIYPQGYAEEKGLDTSTLAVRR